MTQAPSAKPDHQRPELPDFWDKRFAAGTTPCLANPNRKVTANSRCLSWQKWVSIP